MNARLRLPALLIWLTVLWVALWGRVSIGNVLAGLIVAGGLLFVARPTGVARPASTHFHPIPALWYVVSFLADLVRANLVVAWEIITPRSQMNRAIICVPMHSTSAGIVTLVANTITLTPGTITIDVDEATDADGKPVRSLYVHVLHLRDIESVRRDIHELERLAIRAFGTADELAAVDAKIAGLHRAALAESQGDPS